MMKRVASFLANQRVDCPSDAEEKPPGMMSFGRRMNKRSVALEDIEEMEGEEAKNMPIGYTTTVSGKSSSGYGKNRKVVPAGRGTMMEAGPEPAAEQGEKRVSRESKFTEHMFSPSHKRINDRKRVNGSLTSSPSPMAFDTAVIVSPNKRAKRHTALIEPTAEFAALMLGGPSKKRRATVSSHHSTPTKQAGPNVYISTPNKKDSPSTPTSFSKIWSPRSKQMLKKNTASGSTASGPMSYTMGDGTCFEFPKPPTGRPSLPPGGFPQLPVPPRVTSRNFSLIQYKVKTPASLQTLPQEIRNTIFELVLVADHEVIICTCGFCSQICATQQPAIAKVNRKLRNEALPIFYGGNKFMIRCVYKWKDPAPVWLRVLSQKSRDMIEHVEIETRDIASAVCMMATLGYQLSQRLPRKQYLAVMSGMTSDTMWMTFTAINKVMEEYALPTPKPPSELKPLLELRPQSSIHLWDDVNKNMAALRQLDGADETSLRTIGTSILDIDANEQVIMHGEVARSARQAHGNRYATVDSEEFDEVPGPAWEGSQSVIAEEDECEYEDESESAMVDDSEEFELTSFERMLFHRHDDYLQQRADFQSTTHPYSIGEEVVRASSDTFALC
ncbi:hypothetical protein LTR36_000989 [Oleoguttula mirabilis]|uniref:Uncharacterized protein n=1 Tax=Oleoguttula mirabilis TaxID=1507867 RepID=A0AAV9JS37_9PEZI|nr:hypothetical protein LTR36_000989 [Oleoguttula mirabilis]